MFIFSPNIFYFMYHHIHSDVSPGLSLWVTDAQVILVNEPQAMCTYENEERIYQNGLSDYGTFFLKQS